MFGELNRLYFTPIQVEHNLKKSILAAISPKVTQYNEKPRNQGAACYLRGAGSDNIFWNFNGN